MQHHADELLYQLRLEVNRAEKTASDAVACSHRERAVALALELDRWVSGGNPPPADWCRGFLLGVATGDVSLTAVVTAADDPTEDAPLVATCSNQPLTALPDPT